MSTYNIWNKYLIIYDARSKKVNLFVDAQNTGELDVPGEGSEASKAVHQSTPVAGIIAIIAVHVNMSFHWIHENYFAIKSQYVLYWNRWWWRQWHP